MEGNLNFRDTIHFNIFSKKFIFNFTQDFKIVVDENKEAFDEQGLLRPYYIAVHFKV